MVWLLFSVLLLYHVFMVSVVFNQSYSVLIIDSLHELTGSGGDRKAPPRFDLSTMSDEGNQ